jgi:hypothetical protein
MAMFCMRTADSLMPVELMLMICSLFVQPAEGDGRGK